MKETKFKDTEIGRIPEEWETLYIHQITEISTGATPSTNINEYWENGTIRWMSSGELNNKIIYDVVVSHKKDTTIQALICCRKTVY